MQEAINTLRNHRDNLTEKYNLCKGHDNLYEHSQTLFQQIVAMDEAILVLQREEYNSLCLKMPLKNITKS